MSNFYWLIFVNIRICLICDLIKPYIIKTILKFKLGLIFFIFSTKK